MPAFAWCELVEVTKRYRIAAAAHNLARIMRRLFGIGKQRVLQAPADLPWLVRFIVTALCRAVRTIVRELRSLIRVSHALAAQNGLAANRFT